MEREICRDCFYIVEGWICDQVETPIEDIEECPEGGWYHDLFSE